MRFVLIDELLELEPGRRAVARKTFAPGDPVFADHFPGVAVVPGVLITEAMGQTGGWLLAATLQFSRWPLLAMIDRAKFRRLAMPGDEIRLEAELRSSRGDDFEMATQAFVSGERVAEARLVFHAVTFSLGDAEARRFEEWARTLFRDIGGEALMSGPRALSRG